MEGRIELRRKEYKKSFDDPRQRRAEQQVQIRRQNRDIRLSKKRQQAFMELPDAGETSLPTSERPPNQVTAADIALIPALVEGLNSPDPDVQLRCCKEFRRLLSVEGNPPIQQVIDARVIPRFVSFLQNDARPDLQFEAAWSLTNVASGTRDQTRAVVEGGATPELVRLLSVGNNDVREQVWESIQESTRDWFILCVGVVGRLLGFATWLGLSTSC